MRYWNKNCKIHPGDVCSRCGSPENLTKDHIIPSSLGGKWNKSNMQVLCGRCNNNKGNDIIVYKPRKGQMKYINKVLNEWKANFFVLIQSGVIVPAPDLQEWELSRKEISRCFSGRQNEAL